MQMLRLNPDSGTSWPKLELQPSCVRHERGQGPVIGAAILEWGNPKVQENSCVLGRARVFKNYNEPSSAELLCQGGVPEEHSPGCSSDV